MSCNSGQKERTDRQLIYTEFFETNRKQSKPIKESLHNKSVSSLEKFIFYKQNNP